MAYGNPSGSMGMVVDLNHGANDKEMIEALAYLTEIIGQMIKK